MDKKQNAKYAFYYLLSLVTLIFMALSVGMIIFAIIDKSIVDVLRAYTNHSDGQLRFAISALIISTPIYYTISYLINKGLKRGELSFSAAIRRWLSYFILLISSLIIVGVLIAAINVFLSGELSSRFILKALTIFIISAFVFSFYLYDLKRESISESEGLIKIFTFSSLAIVIIVFIAAWFFVESPKIVRARRLDQNLLNNIYNLEGAINSYYGQNKELPSDLGALLDNSAYLDPQSLIDPETKVPLVYHKQGDKKFEICATFRLPASKEDIVQTPIRLRTKGFNNHQAGYQCLPGNLYETFKNLN